ncbi:MAG: hypothetical protein F6K47_22915 [Symploca sp. SIO2E6]|nr:hypothetical protein [Symploca sp. SIO2E6]
MSQVDYAVMTNEQLKQYMLDHRDDKAALSAYLERRHQQQLPVIANVKDADFDNKFQAAVARKMRN